jgi:glycosyltransferase involved in cell wall biosynthesis
MPQFIEELKGRKLIGSVGRLTGVKNHITIVRALSYIPEVTYIIVGQGPLKEYLLSEALKCNVGDRFFIIDTLEHCYINGFLSMLSVFMFPSLSEAFGLAVIEAAAIPLPIVTINAAWVEDTLGSSFTTKVDSNPQSIAEITKSIIYNDKYASSLKAISYSIASKYDFSKMADSYMNKLIDLIGG